MSAAEVIQHIKQLPPEELAIVRDFLREPPSPAPVEYITSDEVRVSADKIFGQHSTLFQKLAQ